MTPIFIPMHQMGYRGADPIASLVEFVSTLLLLQYMCLIGGVVLDMFDNKRHALLWTIPGWPLVELAYVFINHFRDL